MVYCFEVFGNISSVVGGRDIWYVPVEIYYKQPSVSEAYFKLLSAVFVAPILNFCITD
jgi:hypothetical protein